MKYVLVSSILFTCLGLSHKGYSQSSFPELQGPYLGQKEPGTTPQVFAPGLVSLPNRFEIGISFSPDLKEVFFSTQKPKDVAAIQSSKVEDGKWQPIEHVNFTAGKKAGEMEPFVSLDGNHVYFTAYNADFSDTKIWVVDRTDTGWGAARKLASPINNEEVFNSTLANNGDLFYTDIFKGKTYSAKNKNGRYPEVELVNIEFGMHPFIAPEQDYLLVDGVAKDKNRKDKDIYVYFKNADGTWSKPINLGEEVNSTFYETVPSVTPDGKYLFFSRYNEEGGRISDFYWVSTEVIERLRPKA